MDPRFDGFVQGELRQIKDQGLFKEEWPIVGHQDAPAQLIEQLCEALDYESHLLKEGPEGQDRWDNVRELVAAAAEWSEEVDEALGDGTPLERFLADAALQSAADTPSRCGPRRAPSSCWG